MTSQHVSYQSLFFFLFQMESLFPVHFCSDHTSGWHIDTRSPVIYRHKKDQGDNGHFLIFLAGSTLSSGLDRKRGTSSRNQEVRQHATSRAPLRAQWRVTNLVSSDRTRSVSYTVVSPCVGGQIKDTLIHNRKALLNPAGALIKIERAMLR